MGTSKEEIIAYVIYIVITGILGYAANLIKKLRADKNSFYSKQLEFLDIQKEELKKRISEDEYNHAKAVAQDIIYKVEQLGKELAWDAVTKHSKATELISSVTGLSDEQIFDIIKTTVGMMNSNKKSLPAIQTTQT